MDSAHKGDKIAMAILEEETDELVHQLRVMMKKMDVDELNVSFAGSLVLNKNVYSDMLLEKIKSSLPTITIVKAKYSPVQGAIRIAREMLNA